MKRIILSAFITVSSQTALVAQQVWSEDFEAKTAGADDLSTIGAPWAGPASASYKVVDEGTPFGEDNKYLKIQAFGDPWSYVDNTQRASPVCIIAFDVYFDADAASDGFLRLAVSGTTDNVALIDIGGAKSGKRGATSVDITYDKSHRIEIVSNTSGGAFDYRETSLADNKVDVWIDGKKVETFAAKDQPNDGFGLFVNNGTTVGTPVDAIYVDNFTFGVARASD